MKRKIAGLLALTMLASLFLLSGCGRSGSLPEGMEEDAVKAAGQEVLDHLIAGEYQAVADAFRADLREEFGVTADSVKAAMDTTEEAGAYVKSSESTVAKGDPKNFDEPYAVAIFYCEHEEKDVIYEFSFDTDLTLVGLRIKPKK